MFGKIVGCGLVAGLCGFYKIVKEEAEKDNLSLPWKDIPMSEFSDPKNRGKRECVITHKQYSDFVSARDTINGYADALERLEK